MSEEAHSTPPPSPASPPAPTGRDSDDPPDYSATEIPPQEQLLLAGADRRIARFMLALGLPGVAACWWWGGVGWAVGFAVGAAVSALSFQWMKTAVSVLADALGGGAAAARPRRASRAPYGAGLRFALRFALIALAGYAIFESSVFSLEAFFAGLFLSIASLMMEAGYQVYYEFRKRQ